MAAEFQQGLCGCCNNCKICCCTWCCYCIVAGKTAEKVGESCCLHGCVTFIPIVNFVCRALVRQKVREQKGIPGSIASDLLVSWCCAPCGMCQEANEVKIFDSAMVSECIERE